ncbi:MAG TPA: NAD+ synthase [Bacillota bacterium]|nr:NAD+ synthase [Bacillota bacterium]HOL09011.1 NAD+ synthase [Bacillota bacterium]HPO96686.1 NAD+ synthase [Bacillota bacterium]
MKVTIAQLNPIVGDIKGNKQLIMQAIADYANQSDLIVFSELFLVGYPPKDLVDRSWFIARSEAAIAEIVDFSKNYPDTGIIFGAPVPTNTSVGKGISNSALFIHNGQIILNQPKSLLPTYDVFDEARHFDPAEKPELIRFKGEMIGLSVCEDAWNDPQLLPYQRLYAFDPITEMVQAGAAMIINISASPFYLEKEQLRYKLISNHSQKHQIPFIFVNQVGGNDELIFDGGSMVFDKTGAPIYIAPFFEESVVTVDTQVAGNDRNYSPLDKIESLYQALVLGTRDYFRKCGFTKAVIGLSGGIDSALTCCIAVAALGAENVKGVTMPSPYSSVGSVEDSRLLAANLGIEFDVIPINNILQSYLETLAGPFSGRAADVTEENIQARIRGNIIMAYSNKFGYLALSTGNKSELAVGYCTLYGDMSGGLSVISDVPKTMVYELSKYVNRKQQLIPPAIIEKVPSAELRPNQCDQDTLPPYPVLDGILQLYIEEGASIERIIEAGYEPDVVKWVVTTVDNNEYKRKQAAPGLKVTTKAFGVGRRMPIAKKISG